MVAGSIRLCLFRHLRPLADRIETAQIASVVDIAVAEIGVGKAVSSLVFLSLLACYLHAHFHFRVHVHVHFHALNVAD